MTVELLTRSPELQTQSESALSIIDAYRNEFEDRTSVSPLEMEFPYMRVDNKESIYVLETGDNRAGAFKWRGALVGALALLRAGHERLVVPSAGNHARGAILAAQALGMSIDVVVPRTAPRAKREGLRELWDDPRNRVHVHGESFDEALAFANEYTEAYGGALLHPYDDPNVKRGQGTVVNDLLRLKSDVDNIAVAVGGAGLLDGILNELQVLGREDIHVTAVEAPGSNSLSRSLDAGKLVSAEAPNPLYGGSAVQYIGEGALHSAMRYPNLSVVTGAQEDVEYITETYVESRKHLMRTDIPAFEPTSIVPFAGLYQLDLHQYRNTVVIGTGHNAPLRAA